MIADNKQDKILNDISEISPNTTRNGWRRYGQIAKQIPKLKHKGYPNVDDRRMEGQTEIINQKVRITLQSGQKLNHYNTCILIFDNTQILSFLSPLK